MTQFELVVLPEVEAEIAEAFFWYLERSPIAADAFRAEALDAIEQPASHAAMWPEDAQGVRRYILGTSRTPSSTSWVAPP